MTKRTLVAVAIVVALVAGVVIGAGIRPARAAGDDDGHRVAIATEQIARELGNVSRHIEGLQRCACK
jgi:hypothetical protein